MFPIRDPVDQKKEWGQVERLIGIGEIRMLGGLDLGTIPQHSKSLNR